MFNLNPYNEPEFQSTFQNTEIYKKLEQDFDFVSFKKHFVFPKTPREYFLGEAKFSAVPFYYLQPLMEKNPDQIYDLGCGCNIFKKYVANIIGVSPTKDQDGFGDIHDLVDEDYVKGHQNFFDSVFSINALHYIGLENFEKLVLEFISMVKIGGRGFLAVNLQRMIERTSGEYMRDKISQHPTKEDYEKFIHKALINVNCTFLIKDIDFSVFDDPIDGNIRLVFEK